MSKQVYFVICVDTETKQVSFDDSTLVARFPEGTVWDTQSEEWESEITIGQIAHATEILKAGIQNA
jgi:hypothetical protein